MNNKTMIKNSTLGVIIGLVVSVWWIFMGLDIGFRFEASDAVCYWLTLGGHRHTIMTILVLVLVPVCALEKQWGFLAAMVLGAATLILSVVHVVYMLIVAPSGLSRSCLAPLCGLSCRSLLILGIKSISQHRRTFNHTEATHESIPFLNSAIILRLY